MSLHGCVIREYAKPIHINWYLVQHSCERLDVFTIFKRGSTHFSLAPLWML